MGVFDDKKFEELDWISQATEPIDSAMNEVLGQLPDIVPIDFKLYRTAISNGHWHNIDLSIRTLLRFSMEKLTPCPDLSYQQLSVLEQCFTIEVTGDELELDFEKEVISGGEINFVKINSTMDEKVLESMLGSEGIDQVSYLRLREPGALIRANEIMELLGKCEEGLKTRSAQRKRILLSKRLRLLFKNNEWKIKDTELANKVGKWIIAYIVDGNLAAFSNFCRLKVMTHKDQPIYSMKEVE